MALVGTFTLVIVGETAFEITVVVLSMASSVPSFTTTVNVVVSEVAVLLSVGLYINALNKLCKLAVDVLAKV